ncbi:MAG: pseudouridine synthase [Thermoflexales bacterium]
MRLQKLLAQSGFGARRKCEALIVAGRVTVNGQVAQLGATASPGDDVRVDGKPIALPEEKVYIALHKPVGYASDRSNPRNKTVFDLVRVPQRLFAVGRLDKDSSGLILLTNDGEFAYRLTHPKFEHEKEYHVLVAGRPSETALQRWRSGVLLPGETAPTAPADVQVLRPQPRVPPEATGGVWLRVVMREGRKRQIRRVAGLLGHPVIQLIRVRVGCVTLGDLESGKWRRLTDGEVAALERRNTDGRFTQPPDPHDCD